MIWAKHASARLVSGEIMETFGSNRRLMTGDVSSVTLTPDGGKGTMITNKQFFDDNSSTNLNNYNIISNWTTTKGSKAFIYPYFPTKMLFGTANGNGVGSYSGANASDTITKEADITNETDTLNIKTEGWIQSIHSFGSIGVSSVDRYSLSNFNGSAYEDFTSEYYSTNFDSWLPSFVYCTRTQSFVNNTDIAVSKYDDGYAAYNKIVYTVTLPGQSNDCYYPYNYNASGTSVGNVLKYAGLFCDAAYIEFSNNDFFQILTGSPGNEFRYGMPWAKKSIDPVTKTYNISIDFVWSIYIPYDIAT
jgi:hypothetical protein